MIEQRGGRIARRLPQAARCCRSTADITTRFALPAEAESAASRVGFFPGSTIGNFEPHEAAGFLRNAARILGRGATLIVGVDLIKPVEILNAAYNDKAGVTAKFNLQSAHAHQSRARRHLQSRRLRAPRLLQPRAQPHRDASRQPQAAEGQGRSARPSTSAPARPSTPRTATSTAWSRWPRWPAASAGCRRRPGATPTNISPSRLSRSRATARASDFSRWPRPT